MTIFCQHTDSDRFIGNIIFILYFLILTLIVKVCGTNVITPLKNPALRDGFLRGVCHSLEKKSDSELNFTPENTPHMLILPQKTPLTKVDVKFQNTQIDLTFHISVPYVYFKTNGF